MLSKLNLMTFFFAFSFLLAPAIKAQPTENTAEFFSQYWQSTPHLLAAPTLTTILNQREPITESNPEDFFRHVLQQLRTPKEYFSPESEHSEVSPIPNRPAHFSGKDIPLLIVIPGIFGEFIAIHPFEETLREDSPLKTEYLQRLANLSRENDISTDPQLNMLSLKQEPKPLSELVRVGAVKNSQGEIIANTLILHTQLMSMESIGVLRGNSIVFHRRISKFFKVLGRTPSQIAMIGYSRGAMNGLDLLAMADKYKQNEWTQKIKAFVSIGGVLYGSELADQAFSIKSANPPIMTQRLALLKRTARALQIVRSDDPNKKAIVYQNTQAWISFLTDFALLEAGEALKDRPTDSKAWGEYLRSKWTNVKKLIEANADVNLRGLLLVASDIAFRSFNINLKVLAKEYNNNVRRFQLLTREAAIAAESLTTSARLDWWRNNEIPNSIHYFSVAASLVAPEAESGNTSEYSYNRRSPDYFNLLQSYFQFAHDLQIPLNDSQVGLHKAVFWPQLSPLLNKNQLPYEATHLGVFQTHHWGLTLEVVTPMQDKSVEPFPRIRLLEALTATIF